MRLIDADALKEKKVYSHERHEKIVPVAEIDWSPTIDAIPVEWLDEMRRWAVADGDNECVYVIAFLLDRWQKEQEAR